MLVSKIIAFTISALLVRVATAVPSLYNRTAARSLTAATIAALAPDTTSCTTAPYPSECATAAEAAPAIVFSYHTFNISSFGAQAALLSLMLYESGDFKYNANHYPGVPGQGTRNMQSPAFNAKYAQWLAATLGSGISAAALEAASAAGPAAVLELINESQRWSFGSAAWFLAMQCEESIAVGLAAGTEEGWAEYLIGCVGTPATEERTAVWRRVMASGHW